MRSMAWSFKGLVRLRDRCWTVVMHRRLDGRSSSHCMLTFKKPFINDYYPLDVRRMCQTCSLQVNVWRLNGEPKAAF